MRQLLSSDDTELCLDCFGLVGASHIVPPHAGLLQSDLQDRGEYFCLKCGVPWRLGGLGWKRVVSLEGS